MDRRRRRGGRPTECGRGERRRRAQRRGPRSAARRLVDRLRLRRRQANAVRRVGRTGAARRVRADEAARRGGSGRRSVGDTKLVALRPDVLELRAHDAAPRGRARRGGRGRRPARLAHLRRAPRRRDEACHGASLRRLPRRRGRGLQLGRVRGGDLRRRRAHDARASHHDRRVRSARATPLVFRSAQRARRAGASALARGAA